MSTPLLVQGAVATLTLDSPNSVTAGVWYVTLTAVNTTMFSVDTATVIQETDLSPSFMGQMTAYTSSVYSSTPGMVTITTVSLSSGSTTKSYFGSLNGLTSDASGTFNAAITAPATLIAGTAVTPDSSGTVSGSWSIESNPNSTYLVET